MWVVRWRHSYSLEVMKVKIRNKPLSANVPKSQLKCLFSYTQIVQLVVVALLNSRKKTIFFPHIMKM